jgi:trimethylamine--corrinoid protein Co-methyltransferase
MYDRNGEPSMHLGSGRTYVGTGVTNLNYLDPRDHTVQDFTLEAFAETAKLTDYLTDIDFIATPGVVRQSKDLPIEIVNQWEFFNMTANTTKPVMVLIAGQPELADIYDMAELVAGGADALREKPYVIPYLNSVSPLLFNLETIEKLFESADRGLPVCAQAAPQVGATGPATIAGTCVISAAETLLMLVLQQLRAPGTAFLAGTVPFLMDMRNGSVTAGGPDGLRFMVLMSQLCRWWGLPCLGMTYGGDSKGRRRAGGDGGRLLRPRCHPRRRRHDLRRRVYRGGTAVLSRAVGDQRRGGRDEPTRVGARGGDRRRARR